MEQNERKFLIDLGKFVLKNVIIMTIVGVLIACILPYFLIIAYILTGIIGALGAIIAITYATWCLIHGHSPTLEDEEK